MARRPTDSLIFDSLRLEGGLFVPSALEKAARGEHTAQKPADYRLPKGLALVDEQGRAFRIATALYKTFEPTRARRDVDATRATVGFVTELLRDAFGYADFALCPAPVTLADRAYPITAFSSGGRVPVIIAPHTLELDEPDERFAVLGSGSRRRSAYQLAQQFLNASVSCTWAILTNGRQLRLVRDADTLTRPAFLEADLDLILRAQRYPDFAAVWRLFHSSRAGSHEVPGDTYPWEAWKKEGQEQGERVRKGLRTGVTEALLALGTGFLERPANEALRLRLQTGDLAVADYLQQLFRLIYRFLFLFTVEERGLLHVPDESPESRRAREAYAQGYAFRRLRDRALRRSGFDRYGDIWTSVQIVFAGLAGGEARLALPALGGLFATTQCPDIDGASLDNRVLLTAMRHLRWASSSGQLAAIDYRNMGPEELGSVYESLLELVPTVNLPARRFGFVGLTDAGSTAGNARKTSGSYYTPDSLVQELIKSALDPVIAQKIADHSANPVEALLALTVCDPSCGSGHFLLAAARRLAAKISELRAPDGALRPDDYRHALREVASRCLFGVDLNPMAVELCRVALWLETVDPGKPLGFLNHHIRPGNSLLGTTPELIAKGLPDDAFTAIEGDDKAACSELKRRNKSEREGFGPLFQHEEQAIRDRLRQAASAVEEMDDSQADLLHRKEAAFVSAESAPDYRRAKLLADLWCAAFVIKKHYRDYNVVALRPSSHESQISTPVAGQLLHAQDELFGQSISAGPEVIANKAKSKSQTSRLNLGLPFGITTQHLRDFVQGLSLSSELQSEVADVSRQFSFFHWHLAFPKIFASGGFDCILGNPPWDRVKFDEQDWFAERMPDIANAQTTAARKKLVEELASRSPTLLREFEGARREFEGLNAFIRVSGVFPNGSSGELNLATLFAERSTNLVGPSGQAGLVLPTTVVTDKSAQPLCRAWIEQGRLVAIFDFENRAGLFPEVDSRYKFAIITLRGVGKPGAPVKAAFYLQDPAELLVPENLITISVADIEEVNPNTLSFPVSRTIADAQLMLAIHRRAEPLLRDSDSATGGSWGYSVFFVFEMNKDSSKFSTSRSDGALPLLEAKLVHQFEHRAATFEGQNQRDLSNGNAREALPHELADANFTARPRFWVPATDVVSAFKRGGIERQWLVVARAITNATNERTVITCIIPRVGMGHSCWGIRLSKADAPLAAMLCASLNSFVLDYAGRQKISGMNLSNFIIKQLPVLSPKTYTKICSWADDLTLEKSNAPSLRDWLLPRLLELTYTAWDLEAFAVDCGWNGPPFRWDEERRFLLRCEVDAAYFHLYLDSDAEWQQQPDALIRAFPTPRSAVAYVMDTFLIARRKDEAEHGRYRTKEIILQIYDALEESIRSGQAYQTRLDPPPADLRCCHPPRFTVPAPEWMDRPLILPSTLRGIVLPDRYRATVVPHLLYQAGGSISFERFRRAYWLLTEPKTLQRYANNSVGTVAKEWAKVFREQ
ncbi:MAG TPA: N-6 DNA methylase, partial [Opitutaceae bacterium]|nr:N-6 DNA methylase [Opitutaceae bacterium]